MKIRKKYLYFLFSILLFSAVLGTGFVLSQKPSFEIAPSPEPIIQNTTVTPSSGPPGTIFTITTKASDISGIGSVIAHIQIPDGTDVALVTLYDDGLHNDGAANDGIYGNKWDSTGLALGTYYIDIVANDTLGYFAKDENGASFKLGIITPENCTNLKDDDEDGNTDCGDPDCFGNPACIGSLTASITSPNNGDRFKKGDNIFFNGLVSGGIPPYTYSWQYFDFSTRLWFDMGNTQSLTKNDFNPGLYAIYFTVKDSVGTSVSVPDASMSNISYRITICAPPTASIISPLDGDVFEQLDTVHFEGNWGGQICGPVTLNWTSNIDGNIAPSPTPWKFDTFNLSVGTHQITFKVTDGLGQVASPNITITITAPPSIKALITSPENESVFAHGDPITFDCLVAGGTPPYTYSWISNIDGNIGNLQTFNKTDLSIGDHKITLIVTDSTGATDTKSIESIHIIPDHFDWRNVNGFDWMTSVKCQSCGDCWAFATVGVVEAKYKIEKNDPTLDIDLSEQYLVSGCCWAGNCEGGNFAGYCIKNVGIADEGCYSYRGTDSACPSTCDDGSSIKLWKINEAGYVSYKNRAELQYNLIQKGPLFVTIDINGRLSNRKDKDGCYIFECGGGNPNHAIVLVGYNNTGQYWIIKNSWGANPSDPCSDGYESLDYATCTLYWDAYVMGVSHP
jgi:hypothetical protein